MSCIISLVCTSWQTITNDAYWISSCKIIMKLTKAVNLPLPFLHECPSAIHCLYTTVCPIIPLCQHSKMCCYITFSLNKTGNHCQKRFLIKMSRLTGFLQCSLSDVVHGSDSFWQWPLHWHRASQGITGHHEVVQLLYKETRLHQVELDRVCTHIRSASELFLLISIQR